MGSQVDPPSLLVFTTSQIALPRRYPHPHKPNLIVPPLIHRALHSAFDPDPPRVSVSGSTIIIPDPESIVKHDLPLTLANNGNAPAQESSATGQAGVEAAALDSSQPPTSSDRPDGLEKSDITDAEITVKLHLVGPSKGPSSDSASSTSPSQISERRLRWIVQALEALRRYKGLVEIDTLLLGFKGIDYKGKKTVASEFFGCGAEGLEEGTGAENVDEETAQGVLDVWRTVTAAKESQAGSSKQRSHHHGSTSEVSSRSQANGHASNTHFASTDGLADTMSRVQSLGTLYLPLSLLEILSETASPPAINSMDTPDCHHLPKEYSSFARSKGIELWAGGGGEGSGRS